MNTNGIVIAELNKMRREAQSKVDGIDALLAQFGGGNVKAPAKRHRRTKAEITEGGEAKPVSSRSEKMKAKWAERKAKEAAEQANATEGADLAAAAGD